MALLEVKDLSVEFDTVAGPLRAVDGLSFDIDAGSSWALVGESGSGKSVTALALMGLLPAPPARIVSGTMALGPDARLDLATAKPSAWQGLRGRRMAMVFQDPRHSLNPYQPIGKQLLEVLELHSPTKPDQRQARVLEVLGRVGYPATAQRLRDYPHQLSGGMCQRVMIAMALLGGPELLIADEPTSALDVTIQAQVLDVLRDRCDEEGLAMMVITHDMAVVAELADRATVMYAGHLVESGPAERLLDQPRHPYSAALLRTMPRLAATPAEAEADLAVIPGAPPDPWQRPTGCPYRPRCEWVLPLCAKAFPQRHAVADDHWVCCYAVEASG